MQAGLKNMLRKILFKHIIMNAVDWPCLCIFSRDVVDEFSQVTRLGQAQDFFENFSWTDDALHDLEAVNINGTHTVICGLIVK